MTSQLLSSPNLSLVKTAPLKRKQFLLTNTPVHPVRPPTLPISFSIDEPSNLSLSPLLTRSSSVSVTVTPDYS